MGELCCVVLSLNGFSVRVDEVAEATTVKAFSALCDNRVVKLTHVTQKDMFLCKAFCWVDFGYLGLVMGSSWLGVVSVLAFVVVGVVGVGVGVDGF